MDVREVGYFEVFRAVLAEYGERWRVYSTMRGKLPLEDEAMALDGFIMSGSWSDTHSNDPWILTLVNSCSRQHVSGKRFSSSIGFWPTCGTTSTSCAATTASGRSGRYAKHDGSKGRLFLLPGKFSSPGQTYAVARASSVQIPTGEVKEE